MSVFTAFSGVQPCDGVHAKTARQGYMYGTTLARWDLSKYSLGLLTAGPTLLPRTHTPIFSHTHTMEFLQLPAEERVKCALETREEWLGCVERFGNDPVTFRGFCRQNVVVPVNPVVFAPKSEGGLGFDGDTVMAWAKGAITKVMEDLRTGEKSFIVGDQGSIWYDDDLKGNGKTKKTRVCLRPFRNPKFVLMLDPSFDAEW